jgi:GTP-binding protein
MEWLGENGAPFAIIFTKIDKISKGKLNENIEKYRQKMFEVWEELPPIFVSSSETREGEEDILNYIRNINQSL